MSKKKIFFSDIPGFLEVEKPVRIGFSAPDLSSNGGLLLAAKAEKAVGIVDALSRCVDEWRNELFITHTIKDQIGQRVFQIACGYEDADDSRSIYDNTYCRRGECELWIKELKDDLRIDRMSCTRFSANQFMVFLHAAAYVLLWHVRHVMLKGTDAECWTTRSLQLRVLKSAVLIKEMKTRIVVEFADDHPERKLIVLALRRA